jgi:hypothetical protein
MKKLLLILVPVFLFSCRGKENKTAGNGEFYEINCEEAISNNREFLLSEAASDVEYIRLETNDSCLVRSGVRYLFTDEFIFIQNRDHILKFSRDGKFLHKIGKPGKGPGEIDLIRIMSIIPDKKEIVVQLNALRKLYHFSFDGELLKTVSLKFPIDRIKVCNDGRYITYEARTGGREKCTFCLMNENWDTLSRVNNHQKWVYTQNTPITILYPSFEPFYYSGNSYYFKSMYNDTVYYLKENRIRPAYFVNLGKYALPFDLRPEKLGPSGIQQFNDNSHNYNFASVFESAGRLFISAHCYGKSPSKYIVYDINRNDASLAYIQAQEPGGFINDWDGAIPFWPVGNATGKQVFMPVSVMTLKKMLETKIPGEIKFPKKREQLKKMIEAADISDNPVLVMVTLK